jgi:hypothetical protein
MKEGRKDEGRKVYKYSVQEGRKEGTLSSKLYLLRTFNDVRSEQFIPYTEKTSQD